MSKTRRFTYMDYAKAIAMFWIIHTHLLQPYAKESYIGVYGHLLGLSTFFFVSGFFLAGSLERHPVGEILRSRIKSLVKTYVLWTIIETAWICAVDYIKSGGFNIWYNGYYAGFEMWFFLNLLVSIVFVVICHRLDIPKLLVTVVLVFCVIILLMGFLPISGRMPGKIILNTLIVWQGYLFHGWTKKKAFITSALLLIGLVILYFYGITETDCMYPSGIRLLVFEGCKAIYCYLCPAICYLLGGLVDSNWIGRVLYAIGSNTKYIYTIHMMLVYVLNGVLLSSRLWMLPKLVLCIAIPLLVEAVLRRTKLGEFL